eukprot:6214812-Pleurochrysis_carterae.AAC.4
MILPRFLCSSHFHCRIAPTAAAAAAAVVAAAAAAAATSASAGLLLCFAAVRAQTGASLSRIRLRRQTASCPSSLASLRRRTAAVQARRAVGPSDLSARDRW